MRGSQDYENFVLIILAFAVLVGASFLFYNYLQIDHSISGMEEVESGEPKEDPQPLNSSEDIIIIHIGGAVKKPGVYRIETDKRVHDALTAAGGSLSSADLDALNLAAPLHDGQKLFVPSLEQDGERGEEEGDRRASGLININQADIAQLETLPGIGPAIGERIVNYREENGRFESLEEIMQVPGIGPKTFDQLKDKISLY